MSAWRKRVRCLSGAAVIAIAFSAGSAFAASTTGQFVGKCEFWRTKREGGS